MDLMVVIPSRGRPHQVSALLDVVRDTAQASTFCVVAVDADDPELPGYQKALRSRGNADLHVVEQPAGHVGAINAGAAAGREWAGGNVKAYAKLDDDHLPLTYGWDMILLDELDKIGGGIAYGDDLLQGARLPTAPVISAPIVDALGWMALPELRHLYCDDVWRELGQAAGCLRYVPRVHIEHRHPLAGKAEWDDGYRQANSDVRYADDGAAYRLWLADGLTSDVAKVRSVLGKEES